MEKKFLKNSLFILLTTASISLANDIEDDQFSQCEEECSQLAKQKYGTFIQFLDSIVDTDKGILATAHKNPDAWYGQLLYEINQLQDQKNRKKMAELDQKLKELCNSIEQFYDQDVHNKNTVEDLLMSDEGKKLIMQAYAFNAEMEQLINVIYPKTKVPSLHAAYMTIAQSLSRTLEEFLHIITKYASRISLNKQSCKEAIEKLKIMMKKIVSLMRSCTFVTHPNMVPSLRDNAHAIHALLKDKQFFAELKKHMKSFPKEGPPTLYFLLCVHDSNNAALQKVKIAFLRYTDSLVQCYPKIVQELDKIVSSIELPIASVGLPLSE